LVRVLTIVGTLCLAGATVLYLVDSERYIAASLILLLISFLIGGLLGIRRLFDKAKGVVDDARAFMSGDIQTARLVNVGEPKGLFGPTVELGLELEGEDGTVHSFQRDVPVPWPMAWSWRLTKRLPGVQALDLTRLMATELRREGLDVSVARN
jgi:hypothetical protein